MARTLSGCSLGGPGAAGVAGVVSGLTRWGGAAAETADGLRTRPRPLHGAAVRTYADHRIAMFAAVLGFGLLTGRPLLQGLLGTAYPGLTADGWRKLTRNWALFFLFMAALNETVWRTTRLGLWVGFKRWGAIPLTLAFALANIPMLLRHGLQTDGGTAAKEQPPE